MEKAQLCRGSVDWPETACLNSVVDRGGSDRHRVSSAYLTAARRLPVCAAGDDPASDPIIVASLPEAARHLAPAAGQGRGCRQAKIQSLPDRLFHIDIAELRTAEGKLYLFVAIDRTSKFAFVTLYEKADRPTAARFLEALIAAVPYRLHTVLTDNGIQFADLPKNRD